MSHDERHQTHEEIVMTDDMKHQPPPGQGSGKNETPSEDPFHNVILFPSRRKEGSKHEPPPPNAD